MHTPEADRIAELERRLARAEAAIAALETRLGSEGTTLTAPVRVVNPDGRVLAEVGEGQWGAGELRLFTKGGTLKAKLSAHGLTLYRGDIAIRDEAGKLWFYVTVEQEGCRLWLEGDKSDSQIILWAYDDWAALRVRAGHNEHSVVLHADDRGAEIRVEDAEGDAAWSAPPAEGPTAVGTEPADE